MHNQLQQTVNARYHELDPHNRVRLPVIFAWLQEVGAEHALQLGVGLKDLKKLGLTWVLSRLTLELQRPIRGTEQVTVTTWPVTREGRFSIRDYLLTDQQGKDIGRATSSWAAINLKSRRPVNDSSIKPACTARKQSHTLFYFSLSCFSFWYFVSR
ncbi:acyl-[acyl-carrier-protein] thioesterase [Trichlorobacter lovleyi]|uniref:acyl-[acyl-carrier-protein] thioesterase n=1 Tax=Trichlorobacter lovleyi TaxID=313985 RepID=UPI0023F23719|nr:acyl-ACP thioesterase domain-containing protein [Trichlorobacter lovleyi]